ncbi:MULTISPECIES: efflux transporter outer membrane subunit [unclassified Shewanella]|uniref:efflux transporter outer membrane subunit n=1 Tax=unclassified Shewanella TaxID=196818 RepID=UPI001BBEC259|nr:MULTISPECIES: efflux transporter outer membrane subunit [unclassified Shewanella]GIU15738.1 outer membrane protein [Shewanella sp. MBTL60-112-B1]GIU40598.1 outer membrane protein [Shewanella sp. MBTL60-112-B2]
MKLLKLAPLAVALMVSGCAVGPDYLVPTTQLQSEYLNQHVNGVSPGEYQAKQQSAWWHQFNDPVLNQLVIDAQNQAIPLKVAAERIKMAQSYQAAIESFKVPTINVGAGFGNAQISENDPLLGGAITATNPLTGEALGLVDDNNSAFFAGASIAWQVDLFGQIDKQSQAAAIRKEQAVIMREGLVTLITSDVIHNYLQMRGAEERKQIALNTVADQQRTLDLVKLIVKSGYGSKLDEAQAKAMLAVTKSVIPQLEIAENVHKQRLAILLGETPKQAQYRFEQKMPLPNFKGVIPTGLPSDLLNRRPDIRMAEREMAAINQEQGAAIAAQYPKVFLTGSPGVLAKDFDDLFSSDSVAWLGSVGISWNVFDGGRGDAMVELQQARFDVSALRYQHSVIAAFGEVETLLQGYGQSQQYVELVIEAEAETTNAVNKAKSLYKAGLSDYLSILDAQRQQNMLRDRMVAAKLQTAHMTIGLHKALGGNWQVNSGV